jgi:hypothetical protein
MIIYKLERSLSWPHIKKLGELVDCFKSYELREGSTVIEVKVTKTVRLWKSGFCRDMSLDLGVLGQTYARGTNLRFCLGIIVTPRHLRKCLGIYEIAGITILPLTHTLLWRTCSLLARTGITCYSFHAVCITGYRIGLSGLLAQECPQPYLHSGHAPYYIYNQFLCYLTCTNNQFFSRTLEYLAVLNIPIT